MNLLQSLCEDSAKIRELFCYELSDYWISIFNVICKLCPRPDIIVQSYGANQPKVLRSPSKLVSKSTKLSKKESLESSKVERFRRAKSKMDEDDDELEYGHKFYVSGIPLTSLSDFGKPRYGMTKAVWELLVKSRLAVEVPTLSFWKYTII